MHARRYHQNSGVMVNERTNHRQLVKLRLLGIFVTEHLGHKADATFASLASGKVLGSHPVPVALTGASKEGRRRRLNIPSPERARRRYRYRGGRREGEGLIRTPRQGGSTGCLVGWFDFLSCETLFFFSTQSSDQCRGTIPHDRPRIEKSGDKGEG